MGIVFLPSQVVQNLINGVRPCGSGGSRSPGKRYPEPCPLPGDGQRTGNPIVICGAIIVRYHRVYGHCLWRHRHAWLAPYEAFRVSPITRIDCALFVLGNLLVTSGKDLFRGKSRQATVMMLEVVPIKVRFTPTPGMRDISEPPWIVRLILLRLELAFAKRVVVAHSGAAMAARHIQFAHKVQVTMRNYR
jgi:hypothetical protein